MPKIELNDFSIQDLKDMRLFLSKKGRPTSNMTDEIWQQIFSRLKDTTTPIENGKNQKMKVSRHSRIIDAFWDYELDCTTDWHRYCMFINSVLKDMRSGHKASCFFVYQIQELLKFHKDNLQTKYDQENKEWEVWLKNENKNKLL